MQNQKLDNFYIIHFCQKSTVKTLRGVKHIGNVTPTVTRLNQLLTTLREPCNALRPGRPLRGRPLERDCDRHTAQKKPFTASQNTQLRYASLV